MATNLPVADVNVKLLFKLQLPNLNDCLRSNGYFCGWMSQLWVVDMVIASCNDRGHALTLQMCAQLADSRDGRA